MIIVILKWFRGPVARSVESNMITAASCEELANHYKVLSQASGISVNRVSVLKNIARSFTGLATQLDRLTALARDEARAG